MEPGVHAGGNLQLEPVILCPVFYFHRNVHIGAVFRKGQGDGYRVVNQRILPAAPVGSQSPGQPEDTLQP